MAGSIELNGVLQRLDDGLLSHNFAEDLRPKLTSYDLIFHRWVRHGGYCVTLDDLLPLLPSGPGGVCGVQLHSPPLPDKWSFLQAMSLAKSGTIQDTNVGLRISP